MTEPSFRAERNKDGSYTVTVGNVTIIVEDSIALVRLLEDMGL